MKRESQKSVRYDVDKPLNKTESKLLDLHLKKRYKKEVNAFGNKTIYDFLDKNKIIEIDAINLNSTKVKKYIKKTDVWDIFRDMFGMLFGGTVVKKVLEGFWTDCGDVFGDFV